MTYLTPTDINNVLARVPRDERKMILRLARDNVRQAEVILEVHHEFPGAELVEGGTKPPATLKDSAAADAARDEAMDRVQRGADPEWEARAWIVIEQVCRSLEYFTADDIWDRIEKPSEPRVLGPMLKEAPKRGWCEYLGLVESEIPSRNRGHHGRYRSLLFKPQGELFA